MSIRIITLNASGKLSLYKLPLEKVVRSTLVKVKKKMPLRDIDIIIRESEHPEFLKDITGIGGYCPSAHFVQISVDLQNPEFKKHYKEALERTLAHELHHAVRQGSNAEIFNGTLLECVFSEGLADHFSYEITGKRPIWAEDLAEKEMKRVMQKIRPNLGKKIEDNDYYEWFLSGSKKHNIPKWAGYAIGFNLVKRYLGQNPEKSAASLVNVPAKAVFKSESLF